MSIIKAVRWGVPKEQEMLSHTALRCAKTAPGYLHGRFAGYHWIDTFFSRVLVFEA